MVSSLETGSRASGSGSAHARLAPKGCPSRSVVSVDKAAASSLPGFDRIDIDNRSRHNTTASTSGAVVLVPAALRVPGSEDSLSSGRFSTDALPTDKQRRSSGDNAQGGLRITFKDLSYSVPSNTHKGQQAVLLQEVSALFEPSQMAALMGPSGSGKTTLLDLLAGRKTVGKTEGTLLFGGQKPTPAFLRRYTGYVEQFDTLLGDLSVAEMLSYTAELKRPRDEEPHEAKRRAVEELLGKLKLDSCRDVKIGDPLSKGISGGQAKRVNIGIALITNPRVLFLDEPTSGLDSYTANEVMRVVKSLASTDPTTGFGTTVCATIHSPTAATFGLFDRVLLLLRGRVAYFGAQGSQAMDFAAAAWAPLVPSLLPSSDSSSPPTVINQAEWLVDLITEADSQGRAGAFGDAYARSTLKQANDSVLEGYLSAGANSASRHAAAYSPNAKCLLKPWASSSASAAAHKGASGGGAAKGINGVVPTSTPGDTAYSVYSSPSPTGINGAAAEPAAADGEVQQSSGVGHQQTRAGGTEAVELNRLMSEKLNRELNTRSSTSVPAWSALLTLLKYRTLRNIRNPAWLGPRIADKLLISLIILTLYWGVAESNSQKQIVNITSSLFMWCLLPAFGAASYVPSIVLERRLFLRERADGLYSTPTYYAFKITEEIALSIFTTLVFSSYVFAGVSYAGSFAVFWLVYFLDLCVGIVLAYLIAALSPNMDVANAALPAFVTTLLFFAGQLMTFSTMPAYWKWYSYLDFMRYAWGALMINQFEDNDIQFSNGQTILEYYGLKGEDKWAYIGYLSLFWIVFAGLGLAALTFIRHQKR